jgi:UMP-CMP kinase
MKFLTASLVLLLQSRPRTVGGAFASSHKTQPIIKAPYLRGGSSSISSTSSDISPPTCLSWEDSNRGFLADAAEISTAVRDAAMASLPIVGTNLFVDMFASTLPFLNTMQLSRKRQHRVLFILGGPGAGKGTQCANIVDTYKCVHLSVGELLRQERMRGDASPDAQLIEQCLVSGQIVPVEISLNLVRRAMDEITNKDSSDTHHDQERYGQRIFLIDGFPRNFDNLHGWTQRMPQYAAVLGALVYDCPIHVLEQRILSRAETSGRSDDNLASARKRFTTFQEQTMPVVHALEQVQKIQASMESNRGKSLLYVEHIAGDNTISQVWDHTQNVMNAFIQNDVLTANSMLLTAIQDRNMDAYAALCSKEFLQLDDHDASLYDDIRTEISQAQRAFQKYEMHEDLSMRHTISNPTVAIQTGTKAVVEYDRCIYGPNGLKLDSFRETRVWSHEENGWVCVHFSRNPFQ